MTTDTEKFLAEIKARAEKAAGIRSDDFGHSVTDLHAWQSQELDDVCENVIPRLVAMVETARNAGYSHGFICSVCQGVSVYGVRKHTNECWLGKMDAELDRLAAGGQSG